MLNGYLSMLPFPPALTMFGWVTRIFFAQTKHGLQRLPISGRRPPGRQRLATMFGWVTHIFFAQTTHGLL